MRHKWISHCLEMKLLSSISHEKPIPLYALKRKDLDGSLLSIFLHGIKTTRAQNCCKPHFNLGFRLQGSSFQHFCNYYQELRNNYRLLAITHMPITSLLNILRNISCSNLPCCRAVSKASQNTFFSLFCVLMFGGYDARINAPPTAKVIRRSDLGFIFHSKDQMELTIIDSVCRFTNALRRLFIFTPSQVLV